MEIYNQNTILEQNTLDSIKELLAKSSLTFDEKDIYIYDDNNNIEKILYDNVTCIKEDEVIAVGFRFQNVLKYIAVSENYKGENLSDKIISSLTSEAFSKGVHDLFLYTKPQSVNFFLGLGFHLIIETDTMAMMENKKDAFDKWIDNIKSEVSKNDKYKNIINDEKSKISAIVMNANPMSKGHKYLIEQASKESDFLYVFILSNDVSMFKTKDRYEIVKKECLSYDNACVFEGGNYIISPATFPSYFIKDKNIINTSQMTLDAEIFSKLISKKLNIKYRYVGTEPFSETTNAYNEVLCKILPRYNIELKIIDRYNNISATNIRNYINMYKNTNSSDKKNEILSNLKALTTDTTYTYILKMLGV